MITERYFPIWGGAENQLQQLIPYLVRHGCRVEVVTRRWKKEMLKREIVNGTYVSRLGFPGNGHFSAIVFTVNLVLYLLIHDRRADIIHSHGAVAMGAVGSLIARITGISNIAKIATAGRILKLQKKISGRLILAIFKRSDSIICMTDEIQKELETIDLQVKSIYRITNAVDGGRFRPFPEEQRKAWRIERGFLPTTPIILFSGRLVPRKGLDVLLEAWLKVIKFNLQAQLIVLGSGNGQPDSIETQIRIKAAQEGIVNINFEGETNSPESYLGVADIFAFPSIKEGFPNALLEAMASGVVTISSKIGGVVDLINDGKTGLLFPPGDDKVLADNILYLLKNPKIRSDIGLRARKHVLEHYPFGKIAKQYLETYQNILS